MCEKDAHLEVKQLHKIESLEVAIVCAMVENAEQESIELAEASEAAVDELEAEIDRLEEKL